jgi:hypothetical protein
MVPADPFGSAGPTWAGRTQRSTVIAAALGHVGVTLFVAVLLAAGIDDGRLSPTLARAEDVGELRGAGVGRAGGTRRGGAQPRLVIV